MPDNSTISTKQSPSTRNFILNSLPPKDYERLLPDLERVELPLGQIIYGAEEPIKYLYFPNRLMISVIANTPGGQCAEVGVVGCEGLTGVEALLGADLTFNESLVQISDSAHRITAAAAKEEFKRAGAFHDLTLRFTNLMMIQISQTALCNRLHSVEERLARWLLMCFDRAEGDTLQLTQEFLSYMLGVNRVTITTSAIFLQSAGYINYSRGQITIIDHERLENFSCVCYQTVKKQYDRFQG